MYVGPLLLPFVGVLVWSISRRFRAPRRFIIAVRPQPRWRTRPVVMSGPADLERAKRAADRLIAAGLQEPSVLRFIGRPTMDLLLRETDIGTEEVVNALAGIPFRLEEIIAGQLPLRYH